MEDEDLLLGLNWIDENEWNLHRVPTISDVVGNYPVTENEVMIPTWILERLGITNPQEGMSISLSYHWMTMILLRRKSLFWRDTIQTTLKLGHNDQRKHLRSEEFKIRLLSLLVSSYGVF